MGPKKPPIKGLNAEVMRRLDWMLAMLRKGEAIASDMWLMLPTADNPNKMCASIILLLPGMPADPDNVQAVIPKDVLLRLRALLAAARDRRRQGARLPALRRAAWRAPERLDDARVRGDARPQGRGGAGSSTRPRGPHRRGTGGMTWPPSS